MLSLICYLLHRLVGDINTPKMQFELITFKSHFIFHNWDDYDQDNESGGDCQKRVEEKVWSVKIWGCCSTEQKYLDTIENVIRNCRCIDIV